MNSSELSQRLNCLASLLYQHQNILNHNQLIKEADRFLKALKRFEGIVNSAMKGESPSAIEFRSLMDAHFTAETRTIEELSDFSKKVLLKKTPLTKGSSYKDYLQKVISEIISKDKAELAIALLKRLSEKPILDLSSTDTESLLLQVRRLGSLTEEQIEIEKTVLMKNPELLIEMAKAAAVTIKPSNKPETIFKKLMALAKRYYENTGL